MTNIWRDEFDGFEFEVCQIPCLGNSFSYLVCSQGIAIAIDPGVSEPIENELAEHELKLEAILLTHHHKAHVQDAVDLKSKTEATIIGPEHDDLDFVDQVVMDDDECIIALFNVKVIALPGHTFDHLGFYFPECKALFSGDALFLGGCGKMLEGNEIDYFESMQKIKKLPSDTRIFGGHQIASETVRTLEEEMNINPFLKVTSSEEFRKLKNQE